MERSKTEDDTRLAEPSPASTSAPSGTARALVMDAPGKLSVRRFSIPEPKPGAALLRIACSGICGTHKHTFRGETSQYAGPPHTRSIEFPLICGHENVGTIAAIGGEELRDSEGRELRVGDRVVPAANVTCGECRYCRGDHPYYLCERLEDYGNSLNAARPPHLCGGWAEYMYLLPGTRLYRVPDELPDELAVLVEPLAVTHGLEAARAHHRVREGERAAILGVGPLGICHLIRARAMGAGTIVAIDLLASRLDLAADLGASALLPAADLEPEALVAAVHEACGGWGPDVVVDTSGRPESFVTALRMARPGGAVVEAGAFIDLGTVPVNPAGDICTKNVAVFGVGGEMASAYGPAIDILVANLDRMPLDRIISHRMPLEAGAEALILAESEEATKVIFDPALGGA